MAAEGWGDGCGRGQRVSASFRIKKMSQSYIMVMVAQTENILKIFICMVCTLYLDITIKIFSYRKDQSM